MTPERVDEVPCPDRPGHWILPHWEHDGLRAGITDRTLDFRLRDRPAAEYTIAYEALLNAIPGASGVVVSRQVHGSEVLTHPMRLNGLTVRAEADGHLTAAEGQLLAVTVADCVPVYLRNDASGWIGLLHAGWRGAAAGILAEAVRRSAAVGSRVGDLVIHCGVSICGSCYEVGPEVHEALAGASAPRPAPIDLRAVLVRQALELGVGRVSTSSLCALEHPAFHSHRGSRGAPGRMVAYLGRVA